LKQSQRYVGDKATADTFLQKHFLHWLEAMSLVGDTNNCASLLETLSTLVEVRLLFLSYTVLLTCNTVIKQCSFCISPRRSSFYSAVMTDTPGCLSQHA